MLARQALRSRPLVSQAQSIAIRCLATESSRFQRDARSENALFMGVGLLSALTAAATVAMMEPAAAQPKEAASTVQATSAVKAELSAVKAETDPERDPDLLSCTQKPFCGEPRIELLTRDYITPNELFYVRNHLAVPVIDPEKYVLIVKGKGVKKHKFTLNDLKTKFPKHEVHTTLQCAGNRREDLHSAEHGIFIAPHWVVGA
jgi:DMSO/TMAO reductase YedYZ molybdopterin-dependent catalytic subunit